MTHRGLVSLSEIDGVKEVVTVTQTDDHYLSDFVPFVRIKVDGRLTPEDMRVIQAEKGQVILDIECCVPTCPGDPGELGPKDNGLSTYVSVTPIDDAFEKRMTTAWVEFLRDKITKYYHRTPKNLFFNIVFFRLPLFLTINIMLNDIDERDFRFNLLLILSQIRDSLVESNKLQKDNNLTYSRIEDKLAQFDESHEEFEKQSKSINNELRELNRSVEEE
jgi:hypothetical protein